MRSLTDSYDVLRAVVEGTTDAIFVKDLDGKYLMINSACARFIGKPVEEIVGKRDLDLYPRETALQFIKDDYEIFRTGETRVFEGVASAAGGTQDYRVTKGVVRDEQGKVIGLFGISHDMTERKRAEEERVERVREQVARAEAETSNLAKDELLKELRVSEERYRSLLENANDIIYSHDLEGNYRTINRAGEELSGYTREEILGGLNIKQVVAPEHLELARRMTELKLHGAGPTVYEIDIIAKDGKRLTLEVSTRIAYRDGQPVAVEGIARDITERKRAEERLHRSEERLALAQEAGNIGTFDWNIKDDVAVWTAELESIFGLPRGGFGGRLEHWSERLHPEDHARCETEIRETLARRQESWHSLYRIARADTGELRWIDARARFFYDKDGAPLRMVGVNMDVTERVRAEEERERLLASEREARAHAVEALSKRREVEEKLRTLVDASESLLSSPQTDVVLLAILRLSRRVVQADAYAIWLRDDKAANWSVVASEGLSDEYKALQIVVTTQTPHMPDAPLVVEDVESAPILAERQEAYRREGILSLLTLPLKIDSTVVGTLVFYYRKRRSFEETDVVVAMALANLSASAIGTAKLYEEQRRLRREAEAAESRASFLAEATTVLSSSLDYEETLEAVARLSVPHMADWCAVDIVGADREVRRLAVAHVDPQKAKWARELHDRYPHDPQTPHGVPNVLRTGRAELYEEIPDELLVRSAKDEEHLRLLRELKLVSFIIVPLVTHRRPFGAITFVTAESGRRYGAEDLAFAEDLVHRASLAVENARLYREAQEANRVKDVFLATLSHELRTPLTAILGWAAMLRTNRFDDESTRRAIETIERNARAQKQIVDDVLDASRIVTGNLRLDARPLDLRPLVESAIENIRPAAEAKGVYVSTMLAPDVGVVAADPDRLQQVLWNLLSNAVKFTPQAGCVEVELRRVDSEAVIRVRDTGQGIDPDFLPHVFERFRQGDGSTTRRHGGLGLGLSIVRHLVELHGGTVSVESDGPGHGACFTVTLPLKAVTQPVARPERDVVRDVEAASSELSPMLKGTRVLLVEDEDDAREMIKIVFESHGGVVRGVASAAEAFSELESGAYDVLVSDIGMPDEDGYSLIKRVRELENQRGGRIPAVALTAYARDEDRTRALLAGFHAHVPKPVNPTELITVVAGLAALVTGPSR